MTTNVVTTMTSLRSSTSTNTFGYMKTKIIIMIRLFPPFSSIEMTHNVHWRMWFAFFSEHRQQATLLQLLIRAILINLCSDCVESSLSEKLTWPDCTFVCSRIKRLLSSTSMERATAFLAEKLIKKMKRGMGRVWFWKSFRKPSHRNTVPKSQPKSTKTTQKFHCKKHLLKWIQVYWTQMDSI